MSTSPSDDFQQGTSLEDYDDMLERGLNSMPNTRQPSRSPATEDQNPREFADMTQMPEAVDATRVDDDLHSTLTDADTASSKGYNKEALDSIGEMFNALKHQSTSKRLDIFTDLVELEVGGVDPQNIQSELSDLGYEDNNIENNLDRYAEAGLITDDHRIDGAGAQLYTFANELGQTVASTQFSEEVDSLVDQYDLDPSTASEVTETVDSQVDESDFQGNYSEEVSQVFQSIAKMPDGGNRLKIFMHQAEDPSASYDDIAEDSGYQAQSVSGALSGMKDAGLLDENGEATEVGEEVYKFAHSMHQEYATMMELD